MLELKNVSYRVADEQGGKEIIKDFDLSLPDGEFIVVTGPNGSGKSTLARLLMGIYHPTEGQILLDGEDITNETVTERARRGISFAFQQPVTFKGLRVVDLLRLAVGRPISVGVACEYLSRVGLCAKDYVNREVNASLSGGELKRIEIATVLARGTRVSIFDEPEAGIDIWSFQSLIQVFESVREKAKGTVLIISHQERILNIADRIAVIENGRVKTFGPRDEVLPQILGTASAMQFACERLTGEG